MECNNDYPLKFKIYNKFSNCFQNCSYYYFFDEFNNFLCTINNSCPAEFPKLDGRECKENIKISNMEENLIDCFNNINSIEMEVYCYDNVLEKMEEIFTSNNYDTSKLDGQDEIIEVNKAKIILTTTENQKNNSNKNITTIDLGDCEQSLRQAYNISSDEKIYIKMLEISQEEMKMPKVKYDVFGKLNRKNLTKLSLDSCENNKISLLIPVPNVDNIDKLNSKSGYYNDLCYTATSESGPDIPLDERKKEYIVNAVCQDGCEFSDYDYNTKKAKCSCDAKESAASFKDMKIDKKKLLDNFKNIKNFLNFNLLKCGKVLFSKQGISKNIGFYIFIPIIIFHTLVIILF